MVVEEYGRDDGLAGPMLHSSSEHLPVRIVYMLGGGLVWHSFQEYPNLGYDALREQDTPKINLRQHELGTHCLFDVSEAGGSHVDLGHEGLR